MGLRSNESSSGTDGIEEDVLGQFGGIIEMIYINIIYVNNEYIYLVIHIFMVYERYMYICKSIAAGCCREISLH